MWQNLARVRGRAPKRTADAIKSASAHRPAFAARGARPRALPCVLGTRRGTAARAQLLPPRGPENTRARWPDRCPALSRRRRQARPRWRGGGLDPWGIDSESLSESRVIGTGRLGRGGTDEPSGDWPVMKRVLLVCDLYIEIVTQIT